MKIFIIDDDVFSLSLIEQQVRNLGYTNISTFRNGTDTLDSIAENPNIIILDYLMGDMNGIEVLKKVKKHNPHIYVVMVSAEENGEIAKESITCGAFEFIRKGEHETQKMEIALNQIHEIQKVLQEKKPSP